VKYQNNVNELSLDFTPIINKIYLMLWLSKCNKLSNLNNELINKQKHLFFHIKNTKIKIKH